MLFLIRVGTNLNPDLCYCSTYLLTPKQVFKVFGYIPTKSGYFLDIVIDKLVVQGVLLFNAVSLSDNTSFRVNGIFYYKVLC